MTFEDDFIELDLGTRHGPPVRCPCKALGLDWPPPPELALPIAAGRVAVFRRLRLSQISDDERARLEVICRGAQYVVGDIIERVH